MIRRILSTIGAAMACCVLAPEAARAQGNQFGTAVQLPTFEFFTVTTTVSVPDRGQALLGGINTASDGAGEFGMPLAPFRPFRNRAIGSERGASNISVSAWIHDFEAMDEAVLAQAARERGGLPLAIDASRPLERSPNFVGSQPAPTESPLVALLNRRGVDPDDRAEAVEALVAKARQLVSDGKPGVAKIYYQMALRRTQGDQRSRLAAELEALEQPAIATTTK